MRSSGFELDYARHIQRSDGEIALMKMSVERGLGNREVLRLDDVIEMLALVDALGNDAVIFVE